MKKLLIIASCLGLASATFAQGTVNFSNFASGVNAPVTNCLTGERIASPLYLADLYFSTATSSATDSLQPAGFNVPFSTFSGGGYFLGGSRTVPGATGLIIAQARFWNSQTGATFEEARAAGSDWGASLPITFFLTIPTNPPAHLLGLTFPPCVPEPSTFTLAGLGAAALIFRRRK